MRDHEANVDSPADGPPLVDSRGWTGEAGQLLGGRYRLRAPLGRGGMGEVWRAKHSITGRDVALKLLNRKLSERREMRQRFLREARAAAKVNHPNVIEVLDAFEDGELLALVMPLLEGEALSRLLRREGPLNVGDALELFLPLVSAVGAAHAEGIVHRDLKPDNVFLVNDGGRRHVKVLDFGIAKLMTPATTEGESLTATGSPLGTLWYMAPEQCLGDSTQDHLVDVWALGVILYELLSGRRPIDGQNLAQVMKASLQEPVKPLEELVPGVPRGIAQLTRRMLSQERSARPQTLQEVYERLLEHVPAPQRRSWQRARHDDTRKSASAPSGSSEAPAIGYASTVQLHPTDHSMLSSVHPPARSWTKQAGVAAGILVAASLVFVATKRTSTPAAPAGAARASVAASMQPPSSELGAPLATARPEVSSNAPPLATSSKSAPSRVVTPFRKSPAPPSASPVEARPQPGRATAEGAPRPLDTANPFAGGRPSAAKKSFAP